MTKFILIRHATNDTVGKRLTGRMKGIHLNDEGRLQSLKLAEQLSLLPIKAIYSSPLERALETAEPLAKSLNLKPIIYEDFTDIEFGEWTNCTFEELRVQLSFQHFNSFRSCNRIPGGELMIEAQARMVAGLDTIRQQHPNETIAIISHADLIKAVIAFYAGIHIDMLQRIEISPASVSIIEVGDETSGILLVNHTGVIHL